MRIRLFLPILLLALSVLPSGATLRADENDRAKAGEDRVEDLLRRFGPDAEGLARRIDGAVTRGCEWLLVQQRDDGHWGSFESGVYRMGGTALCALALKKSMKGLYPGSERDLKREISRLERLERSGRIEWVQTLRLRYLRDKAGDEIKVRVRLGQAVEKAIAWVRTEYGAQASRNQPWNVYDIGVVLMLLEARFTREVEAGDGYTFGVDKRAIPRADLAWIKEMVAFLEKQVTEPSFRGQTFTGKGWRYPQAAADGSTVDNSNTQYAVLGLKAAARMGVRVSDAGVWRSVAEYFIAVQAADGAVIPRKPPAQNPADGRYFFPPQYTEPQPQDRARGWAYFPLHVPQHPATGGMTCAGLAALVLARSELADAGELKRDPELASKIDRSLADGMAWVGRYFAVDRNPQEDGGNYGHHYYYLYGLERAGVLCQTEFFGEHAWYPVGARYLCDNQSDDGFWVVTGAPGNPPTDHQFVQTCFALLFLKRATVPVDMPPVVGPVITGEGEGDRKGEGSDD